MSPSATLPSLVTSFEGDARTCVSDGEGHMATDTRQGRVLRPIQLKHVGTVGRLRLPRFMCRSWLFEGTGNEDGKLARAK